MSHFLKPNLDSLVYRSFIKVADEKGWVKSDPNYGLASKTASLKKDLKPSNNFTENLLKLCSGLRDQGFDKYADEIENNFVIIAKEKSIIEEAHPDGSFKIKDIEGNAAILTELDRHLAMMKVVNKEPTGKLAKIAKLIKKIANESEEDNKVNSNLDQIEVILFDLNDVFKEFKWSTVKQKFNYNYAQAKNDIANLRADKTLKNADELIEDLNDISENTKFVTLRNLGVFIPVVGATLAPTILSHLYDAATGNWQSDARQIILDKNERAIKLANECKSLILNKIKNRLSNKPPSSSQNPSFKQTWLRDINNEIINKRQMATLFKSKGPNYKSLSDYTDSFVKDLESISTKLNETANVNQEAIEPIVAGTKTFNTCKTYQDFINMYKPRADRLANLWKKSQNA